MANTDYRALAAKAHDEAAAATLDNVRDRCLRSEAAFLAMAHRQDLGDANRARRERGEDPSIDEAPAVPA
ncbi:hypothetical protein DM806_21550 [Sphingobium lactosutens]|uniref:hypothetical protein n=1 Tax=Sphingobium lactosutens TaxID=522773 RepID=UPI0015BF670D|nr:hypothetical protein [Sphingobium lactosutens]NWK98201.1 hypothetical protein [Sphingobium lactosutens]